MSEIYALTSASLYSIIFNRVGNEIDTASILKSVYARVWVLSQTQAEGTSDPLNRLRALAHRYAIDFAVKNKILAPRVNSVAKTDLLKPDQIDAANLNANEFALLKLAYLNALPLDKLAIKNNCTEAEMSERVKKIISKIRKTPS